MYSDFVEFYMGINFHSGRSGLTNNPGEQKMPLHRAAICVARMYFSIYENQIPKMGNQDYKQSGRTENAITLGFIKCGQNVRNLIWKSNSIMESGLQTIRETTQNRYLNN